MIKDALERVVLQKLVDNGDAGITVADFPDHPEITESTLADIIQRIENGIYETTEDSQMKKDG